MPPWRAARRTPLIICSVSLVGHLMARSPFRIIQSIKFWETLREATEAIIIPGNPFNSLLTPVAHHSDIASISKIRSSGWNRLACQTLRYKRSSISKAWRDYNQWVRFSWSQCKRWTLPKQTPASILLLAVIKNPRLIASIARANLILGRSCPATRGTWAAFLISSLWQLCNPGMVILTAMTKIWLRSK